MTTKDTATERRERVLGHPARDFYSITASGIDLTRAPQTPSMTAQICAQPRDISIDLRRTAFIVVDMQNDFCTVGGMCSALGANVEPVKALYGPIKCTAAQFRAKGVPIVWLNWGVRPDRLNLSPATQLSFDQFGGPLAQSLAPYPGSPRTEAHRILTKDSWGAAIVDELEPHRDDIYVDKHRLSGFWDTPLDSILRNLNVRTVFFAGINADECVLGTLMDANFHGYDTVLIEDCTGTSSPDYCMQATLYNVRFTLGFTVTSTDLIASVARAR